MADETAREICDPKPVVLDLFVITAERNGAGQWVVNWWPGSRGLFGTGGSEPFGSGIIVSTRTYCLSEEEGGWLLDGECYTVRTSPRRTVTMPLSPEQLAFIACYNAEIDKNMGRNVAFGIAGGILGGVLGSVAGPKGTGFGGWKGAAWGAGVGGTFGAGWSAVQVEVFAQQDCRTGSN